MAIVAVVMPIGFKVGGWREIVNPGYVLSHAPNLNPNRSPPPLQCLSSCVEVRVLDRGLGVPAGSGEKIFEQFYRAHDSLSNGIQGSGLGLTLARQIARAHGGDVVYEPRDGGGSCFTLRLPVMRSEQSL